MKKVVLPPKKASSIPAVSSLGASLQKIMEMQRERVRREAEELAQRERERAELIEQRERERIAAEEETMQRLIDEHRAERDHRERVAARARAAHASIMRRARESIAARARRSQRRRLEHHARALNELQRRNRPLKALCGVFGIAVALAGGVGIAAVERFERQQTADLSELRTEARSFEREAAAKVRELEDQLSHAESLAEAERSRLEVAVEQARHELSEVRQTALKQHLSAASAGQTSRQPAAAKISEQTASQAPSDAPPAGDWAVFPNDQCHPHDPLCFEL